MRLLEKQQINSLKAQDKQREINEGAKLAKKVDALRQALSEEEKKLLTFRTETVRKVQEEIDGFIHERNLLEKEIKELRLKNQPELVDIDAEWIKIHSKQEELIKFGESLNEKHLELQDMEKHYQLKFEELDVEEERIDVAKKEAIRSLAKAEENRDTARQILLKAQKAEQESEAFIEQRKRELEAFEQTLRSREIDIQNKEESLENERKEIIKTKAQLKDRRETLERAFKRITK